MSLCTHFRRIGGITGPGELDKFMVEYDIARSCPYAKKQLIDGDVRAPVARPTGGGGGAVSAAAVANTTHHFITVLDLLAMELTSVDEILPAMQVREAFRPPAFVVSCSSLLRRHLFLD